MCPLVGSGWSVMLSSKFVKMCRDRAPSFMSVIKAGLSVRLIDLLVRSTVDLSGKTLADASLTARSCFSFETNGRDF